MNGEAGACRELQDAVVRLLQKRPFYGHLLLGCRRRAVSDGKTIGMTVENAAPVLTIHPKGFGAFSPLEQEALLEHVVKHLLHLHMLRRRERHGRDWDIACDLAINPGIAGLPLGSLHPSRFRVPEGLGAEEYYDLLRAPWDTGNQEGEGVGNAARDTGEHRAHGEAEDLGQAGEGETVDDHRSWEDAQSTPLRLAQEVVRTLVRDALRQSHGEVPGEVRGVVEGWLVPSPIPWRQVLRQFIGTAGRVGRQSTWKREHRRFHHDTPGTRKRRRLSLLIGVDVSDSTNRPQLREAFAREVVRLARGRDSHLTVLYSGSRIQRIDAFRSGEAVTEVYHGGGFTDLRPVFDHARSMHPRPAAVIYLTDGIGPAPERMEFPTLWVLTREGEKPVPWGVELRLEGQ